MPIAAVAPAPIVIKKDPKLANNWKTKKPDQLSDAEVIAMPDDEYMNDKQLAFFRLKLTQLKNDILLNADVTTDTCARTPWWCPTRPTAPPSRKSMRWSCARATASASC
jgi:hypothetical protein